MAYLSWNLQYAGRHQNGPRREVMFSDSRWTADISSTWPLLQSKYLFKLSHRWMDLHSAPPSVGSGKPLQGKASPSTWKSQLRVFYGFCPHSTGTSLEPLDPRLTVSGKPKRTKTQGSGSPTLPQADLTSK